MNQGLSIPAQLPISESFRFLCYLKAKYRAGFFHKSDMGTVCRTYGKDKRTAQKLISELITGGFIGENERTYFLRRFSRITGIMGIGCRAFRASISEIRNRETFEAKQLAARADYLNRYYRRKRAGLSAVNGRGTNPKTLPLPSGLLSETLSISVGKVTKIKRIAVNEGFLKVLKSFKPIAPGGTHAANILQDELPGVFSRDGVLVRREADTLESSLQTFRIKARRSILNHTLWKKRKQ